VALCTFCDTKICPPLAALATGGGGGGGVRVGRVRSAHEQSRAAARGHWVPAQ